MGSLMLADLSKSSTDPVGEARLLEGIVIELGKSTRVEGVLKVLEGKCVLEDSSCRGSGVALLKGDCSCESDEGREKGEALHVGKKRPGRGEGI